MRISRPGLLAANPMRAPGVKPSVKPMQAVKPIGPQLAKPAKPAPMRAGKPKRPSGQFQSAPESAGKMNGGGYGQAQHPQSHEEFEKL